MSDSARSFLRDAKIVGLLTLVSRVMGLLREIVSAHYLGTRLIASAFSVAFTIPNLFRKLFGEGALSAAFIPLYARALKQDASGEIPAGSTQDFAAASVNLLVSILLGITLIGELLLFAVLQWWPGLRDDHVLTLRLTAIMLPYVLMICGTAFLSAILQVHRRFAAPAATPILLNLCHIAVLILGGSVLGLRSATLDPQQRVALQTTMVYWMAVTVLVAGVLQVAMLLPDLRRVGFRFRIAVGLWTPMTRAMLRASIPVAMGAGVVQLSVLLDRGISALLMAGADLTTHQAITHFNFLGYAVRYPMEAGAVRRLEIAQYMYLFPLGIFATALATAIFPSLSSDALEADQTRFAASLRQGILASLWEGIPASVGLIIVSEPATRLLFQHGETSARDAGLISSALVFYAAAIWAFSLLQIVSRAFYAIHDRVTPLKMAAVNLLINLVVELPMIWWIGEAGMAVGTLAAFSVQAVWMLWILDRKIGGLQLRSLAPSVGKMLLATMVMGVACWLIQRLPFFPHAESRTTWLVQVIVLIGVGGSVYVGGCLVLKVDVMKQLLPKRFSRAS